jgi:hypothetical protein
VQSRHQGEGWLLLGISNIKYIFYHVSGEDPDADSVVMTLAWV